MTTPRPQQQTMRTLFVPDGTQSPSRAQLYKETEIIGNGAYGTVYKAKDINNPSRFVALKKVRIPMNEDGVPVSILREITLVRQLDRFQHPNIVRFLDVCHGPRIGLDQGLVLFLVFEYVDKDLAKYIRDARGVDLSRAKIKDIMFQILCGVDFLHSQRIVHRDLKPQNLLISSTGEVKLADFGLAKVYDFTMRLTSVVVTLWYRPPEVLLGTTYATPTDMWSVGCIFGELVKRKPLFPGSTERDQLDKIFDLIGTPRDDQWPKDSQVLPTNFTKRMGRDFEVLFSELESNGINLLQRLLKFNPLERLTAHEALSHPYFDRRVVPPITIVTPPTPPHAPSMMRTPINPPRLRTPLVFPSRPPTATATTAATAVLNTSTVSVSLSLNTSVTSVSADDSGYSSTLS